MAIEFLIGPAGSGKTRTCLTQIRDELRAAVEGPPLLWIAPKQSTFQLERQVLASGIPGFTRLEILPFDHVARRVLAALGVPVRDVLSEEGRVMVLHALLLQQEEQLTVFRRSARSAGFAAQLSQVLRELQRGGIGPGHLRQHRLPDRAVGSLAAKLNDLAILLECYRGWLEAHRLRDPEDLLALAAGALAQARKTGQPSSAWGGLWLDGFAEMTGLELDLLIELLPGCAQATLAFCLDPTPPRDTGGSAGPGTGAPDPTSFWSVTATTVLRIEDRIRALGLPFQTRRLPEADPAPPRFRTSPALARLAAAWAGRAVEKWAGELAGINLVECVDPEAEALLAVQLINRHVRQPGGRYRDVSVIVRRMDGYGDVIQRAFRRHQIPCFADHREPMGHHPVAELTRSALRLAAGGWAHADWIGALKSGLVLDNPVLVDNLENRGLACGLRGGEWLCLDTYRAKAELTADAERVLGRPIAAFAAFHAAMAKAPLAGGGLAAALRALWSDLDVANTLERWQSQAEDLPPLYRAIHHTAWEQIVAWCDALALAFADVPLPAREWATVAEAGLSRLTLGVVPPALDQVLLGAIDRARQPEVQLTILLGLNEGVFPAPPPAPILLNRIERQMLAEGGLDLGWARVQLAAREHYYAYIACTRPSRKLCVAWSRRGLDGKSQVRSSVAERLLGWIGLRPDQAAEPGDATAFDGRLKAFSGEAQPAAAFSLAELFECPGWDRSLPCQSLTSDAVPDPAGAAAALVARIRDQLQPAGDESRRRLSQATVESLHPGGVLVSSVSALEDFAQCPFRHFAARQLRLEEREEFKADAASAGNLLHAILRAFHERTLAGGGAWRGWEPTPDKAGQEVLDLGEAQLRAAQFAPLTQDPLVAWETRRRIAGLAAVVSQTVAWMRACFFNPVLAEFGFGDEPNNAAPAWTLPLGPGRSLKLRGRIDRIDVCRHAKGPTLVAVLDYKSTAAPPSAPELEHGLELQLLAYLAFAADSNELRQAASPDPAAPSRLEPAGAFYVPLTPKVAFEDPPATEEVIRQNYLDSLAYLGRGDTQWRDAFDLNLVGPNPTKNRSRQFRPADLLPSDRFCAQLSHTVDWLKRHAVAILDGTAGAHPVRTSAHACACDHCAFRAFCRFDPLQGAFRSLPLAARVLAAAATAGTDSESAVPAPQ